MIQGTELWTNDIGKQAISRITDRANLYWATNVYKYYNRGTGRLGDSSVVTFLDGRFVVSMKPMIDLETGREYGRSIRHGIPAGEGRFDPKVGKRRHTGYFPGVSQSKFWNPWMNEFRPAFKQIIREELAAATRQHIRQMLRSRT